MNKSFSNILDAAASLHIPDELDLFPRVKAQLNQRRTLMQTLRARPALAMLLAILALILLTGVAYAISRSLGYLPGIGIVEPGAQLRVLAEPVTQTRDGVTVTIEQVVVDSERTVIVYKAEGLSLAAANSKGEGAFGHYANFLRLPNGTLLEEIPFGGYAGTPEPLIDSVHTKDGWPNYVRRLVYAPVDSQTNDLMLILPGLENMPAGTAPENWEIPFRLKPAPPDMTVLPITLLAPQTEPAIASAPALEATSTAALSNVSTSNGVTFSLDNVIEVENGYVFTGKLAWEASTFPANVNSSDVSMATYIPGLLTVTDGNGQNVPIEEVPLNGSYPTTRELPWSVQTNRKNFAGPLTFSLASIKASYMAPAVAFDLDLGPNPEVGQSWEVNRDFNIDGHTIRLLSVQVIHPFDACSLIGLGFQFKVDTKGIFPTVMDVNPNPPGDYSCNGRAWGDEITDPTLVPAVVLYGNIPSGLHQFDLIFEIPQAASGPWQVIWNPPVTSEPLPTAQPEACFTLDKWNQILAQNDTLPPGLGGRIIRTVYDPNSGVNFPTLQLSNLDGSDLRTVAYGGWPSLSLDGTRLAYVDDKGLNLLDLSSGQSSTISSDGYKVVWSPDNTRMMYTNTFHLFVANADGSGAQTIDTGSAQVVAPAGWLPDQQTIVYSAMSGEGFNVRSYNLQSGEAKDLFLFHNKSGSSASISPDGQWVVFVDHEFGAPGYTTFISRIDGSDRRRITEPDIITPFDPIWGPDGQWLILNTYNPNNPDEDRSPVLVNPFTCQALRLNAIHGAVEDWVP